MQLTWETLELAVKSCTTLYYNDYIVIMPWVLDENSMFLLNSLCYVSGLCAF